MTHSGPPDDAGAGWPNCEHWLGGGIPPNEKFEWDIDLETRVFAKK